MIFKKIVGEKNMVKSQLNSTLYQKNLWLGVKNMFLSIFMGSLQLCFRQIVEIWKHIMIQFKVKRQIKIHNIYFW